MSKLPAVTDYISNLALILNRCTTFGKLLFCASISSFVKWGTKILYIFRAAVKIKYT